MKDKYNKLYLMRCILLHIQPKHPIIYKILLPTKIENYYSMKMIIQASVAKLHEFWIVIRMYAYNIFHDFSRSSNQIKATKFSYNDWFENTWKIQL